MSSIIYILHYLIPTPLLQRMLMSREQVWLKMSFNIIKMSISVETIFTIVNKLVTQINIWAWSEKNCVCLKIIKAQTSS